MNNAPNRIWLQWYGDGHPNEPVEPDPADVTWCQDKINEHDIEYVRWAWLPIETAPKDGSLILVTGCNGFSTVVAAAWKKASIEDGFDAARWVGWLGECELCIAEPKLWHPLPEAPDAGFRPRLDCE